MSEEGVPLSLRAGIGVAGTLVAAALGTYTLALLGLAPSMWLIDLFFLGGVVGAVAAALILRPRDQRRPDARRPLRGRISDSGLCLIPFAVLLPGFVAFLASPRLQMSFHGYLHSAYTYEIIHGHLPPANPLLAGGQANDYWLFHVLLAAITHVTRLAPPLAAALVNVTALVASLVLVRWIVTALGLWPKGTFAKGWAALFVLFGLNLFGIVHVLVNWGSRTAGEDPMGLNPMLLSGAARSAGLLHKFLDFNGFPLGVAFFLLALGCALRMTSMVSAPLVAGFLAGAFGALAFHVTTGLFVLTVLPTALGLSYLLGRPQWDLSRRAAVVCGVAALTGLVGLGHYAVSAAGTFERSARIDLFVGSNIVRFVGVTYPLVPFVVLGVMRAARERRSDILMLALVGAGGALLACIALLPGENQYKFDYLAALAFALVALVGLRTLRERSATRMAAGVVACLAIVLLAGNQIYTGVGYARSDLAADDSLVYEGRNVAGGEGSERGDVWEWMRDNVSEEAVVVAPLVSKDEARFLAIGQRVAYVAGGGPFTAGNEIFSRRRKLVEALFHPRLSVATKYAALVSIDEDIKGRDVILAVPGQARAAVGKVVSFARLKVLFEDVGATLYELELTDD